MGRIMRALILFCAIYGIAYAEGPLVVTKTISPQGQVSGVQVANDTLAFEVDVNGTLLKVEPVKSASTVTTPSTPVVPAVVTPGMSIQTTSQPLQIQYYPAGSSDGNGGKVASVNGIPVLYYPCDSGFQIMARNPTGLMTAAMNPTNRSE